MFPCRSCRLAAASRYQGEQFAHVYLFLFQITKVPLLYRQLDFLASKIVFELTINWSFVRGRKAFLQGASQKTGFRWWFSMVNLWSNAGERWRENDVNFSRQNMPHFSDLFFGFPVLGTDYSRASGGRHQRPPVVFPGRQLVSEVRPCYLAGPMVRSGPFFASFSAAAAPSGFSRTA